MFIFLINKLHKFARKDSIHGSVSSVGRACRTAAREVAGSIPGAGPILRVLK